MLGAIPALRAYSGDIRIDPEHGLLTSLASSRHVSSGAQKRTESTRRGRLRQVSDAASRSDRSTMLASPRRTASAGVIFDNSCATPLGVPVKLVWELDLRSNRHINSSASKNTPISG